MGRRGRDSLDDIWWTRPALYEIDEKTLQGIRNET